MTTVTVHPDPNTAHQHTAAPQVQAQPSLPPLPVDFDRRPTAQDYPAGPQAAGPAMPVAPSYPGGSILNSSSMNAPLVETPTQAVVNQALKHVRTRDNRGRIIGLKKLGAGDRMRVMRILGGALTENIVYFGHAMLAAHVREFDGEAVPAPTSALQIEALVGLLDDDGLEAIATAIEETGWNKRADDASTLAAAKN